MNQKIVHKIKDLDKIAIINKENLIFPEESKFKYYYEPKPNSVETDSKAWLGKRNENVFSQWKQRYLHANFLSINPKHL